MKLASGSDTGRIQIGLTVGGVTTYPTVDASLVSGAWTCVSGNVNLAWTGTLENAVFYVNTLTTKNEFALDDCSLKRATAAPPSSAILNGSFEDGTNGWAVASVDTGAAAYGVLNVQGSTDGTFALALGSANASGNAIFSQTLATAVGVRQRLQFAYGAFGAAGRQQRLLVEVLAGTSVLTGLVATANGPGNFVPANTTFLERTLDFVPTTGATLIRFTDQTTAANSVACDGMVDDVLVSWLSSSGNSATLISLK
jgi:hypothetical protein